MAKTFTNLSGGQWIERIPKKTRQGQGKHSKFSSTARNAARKPYRGQGKWTSGNFYSGHGNH